MGVHKVGVKGEMAPATVAPMVARARPVAKAGLVPTISQFMQVMIVNRSSKDSRKHVLEDLKRRAMETLEGRWPHTIIFPEGTCTNNQALVKFKVGAFYPGLPVQPVLIRPRSVEDESSPDKFRKTG